jgi:putative ABC transport system ATP-binding protein
MNRAPSSVLLDLSNIDRVFTMGEVSVQVLNNVSLKMYQGEFLAVVGPSGSGKTTILNLIGGLDRPTSGRVLYKQQELSTATAAELTAFRRTEIGFVFQFYNLVPNLTARENVLVAAEISEDPMDVDRVLGMVGLSERTDHFPSQLSGGEQQRVAIARAIAKNPELLLCDEPTGALDFRTGKLVLRLLVDLNRQLQKTVVVITHNAALAQVADRVIHLRSGEVTEVEQNASPIAPEDVVW